MGEVGKNNLRQRERKRLSVYIFFRPLFLPSFDKTSFEVMMMMMSNRIKVMIILYTLRVRFLFTLNMAQNEINSCIPLTFVEKRKQVNKSLECSGYLDDCQTKFTPTSNLHMSQAISSNEFYLMTNVKVKATRKDLFADNDDTRKMFGVEFDTFLHRME
jgi:hypothetical protein